MKNPKKKTETSKVFCIVVLVFSLVGTALCFVLSFLNRDNPLESLGGILFSCGVVDVLGYLLYNGGLKNSRNKYGVDEYGVPYRDTFPEQDTEAEEHEY